jgi:hypothetical protein
VQIRIQQEADGVVNPNPQSFPLTVSDQDYLTFPDIPGDLNRSIVPLVETSRTEIGSAVVTPVGTAFVIGQMPVNEAVVL